MQCSSRIVRFHDGNTAVQRCYFSTMCTRWQRQAGTGILRTELACRGAASIMGALRQDSCCGDTVASGDQRLAGITAGSC